MILIGITDHCALNTFFIDMNSFSGNRRSSAMIFRGGVHIPVKRRFLGVEAIVGAVGKIIPGVYESPARYQNRSAAVA